MSEYVYRFDNATHGGSVDYIVPVIDMANYPVGNEIVVEDAENRTIQGELIAEKMYSFHKYSLVFEDIGTETAQILNRLFEDKKPISWFLDYKNNPGDVKLVYPTGKFKQTDDITGYTVNITFEDVAVYSLGIVAFLE